MLNQTRMTGRSGARTRTRTALVMEDDRPVRDLIGELLSGAGYAVLEASNGHQGLALAREHHPAVILVDLELPPTSGLEIIEALRSGPDTRHIPIVVVSGHHPDDGGTGDHQISGFFRKPFDVNDLLAHVERVVGSGDG